eukprot:8241602-Pyramimonas_sp.AAC.1
MCAVTCAGAPDALCTCPERGVPGAAGMCGTPGALGARGASGAPGVPGTLGPAWRAWRRSHAWRTSPKRRAPGVGFGS